MKKVFLALAFAAGTLFATAAPQNVSLDKLPQNSQELLKSDFSKEAVKNIHMDRESSWDKYTVYFTSGNTVSFAGGSGDWSKIDMKVGSVPSNLIPVKINSNVKNNYPGNLIKMIMKTNDGYQVKLSGGVTVMYDQDGNVAMATR
ncbi:PepSY-like domain-containing protein [uncultured Rikenella sp.]|uniref:PepSY-like domain-containing protein n=1 Tax=uncultured Rikenella sp. TaxID=368003 RepID=UPI002620EDDF|nr:PepSY-like domain-containing protein [uncultured Rikenella sp.]